MNHCFCHCFRCCYNFRCLPVHCFCNCLNLKKVKYNFLKMFRCLNFCCMLSSTCKPDYNLMQILVANNQMLNFCLLNFG